jgi:hypothetical protein
MEREMATVCITTWIDGDYTKGAISVRYCIARCFGDDLDLSIQKYSTPEGARRAARKSGLTVMSGVAQGHEAARKWLGLPPSPEFQDRARRFTASPLTRTERFTGQFADSFVA